MLQNARFVMSQFKFKSISLIWTSWKELRKLILKLGRV